MKYPMFIINRNRLTTLQSLLSFVLEIKDIGSIFIVDNESTYPLLLEWYRKLKDSRIVVHYNNDNGGSRVLWTKGIISLLAEDKRYIVSDSDVVPVDTCPLDVIKRMSVFLDKYPDYRNIGLGLRIDDLPDHFQLRDQVRAWELGHWRTKVEDGLYYGGADTTFCMMREGAEPGLHGGRLDFPYVAQHMPWYSNLNNLSEEDRYYIDNAETFTSSYVTSVRHYWITGECKYPVS